MVNYYSRYSDPRATFVMIEVRTINDDGRPSQPFHVRITEEEFENMCANSRRQAQRSQWPPPPHGVRWRIADDHQSRSYPHEPFGDRYGFGGPAFTDPHEEYEYYERERKRKAEQQAKAREERRKREEAEHDRKAREQEEKARREYFDSFGESADQGRRNFEDFFNKFNASFGSGSGHQFFFEGEPVSEEEFKKRTQDKNRNNTSSKSEQQLKERLAELAGSAWIDTLDINTLYKKARRRCHPDMDGGSHELWIELEEIAHLLKIVTKKRASRPTGNYSGRSGG